MQPEGAGVWLVTTSVTHDVTGLVPWCDLSARGRRPRPGWRSWPDQELDRLALAAPCVSHHSPAEPPSRTGTHVPIRRRRERMTSLTDLREVVDVVIGVRHPRPHSLRGRARH